MRFMCLCGLGMRIMCLCGLRMRLMCLCGLGMRLLYSLIDDRVSGEPIVISKVREAGIADR